MHDTDELCFIELDDPMPRWRHLVGAAVVVVVVIVLTAPFLINVDDSTSAYATDEPNIPAMLQTSTNICQPSLDFPQFARPAVDAAMPSFIRVCEWFSDPETARPITEDPAMQPQQRVGPTE